eukprot:TRINITY_DN857_c0_g1_i2.p1 TRINITY_DN857_c0_g1~~TRINITY_DN857_c0_g1_i2.p1  ORF type:complete len:103 (+),score=18.26 TRINITY_DN857_c0_g1_i2:113-421(+)
MDLPKILELEEALVNRHQDDVRISIHDLKEIKDKIDQCVSQFDSLPSGTENQEYRKKLLDLQRRIGNMVTSPTVVRKSFFEVQNSSSLHTAWFESETFLIER